MRRRIRWCRCTLNEGRDRNPGDTGSLNADADSRPRTLNEGRDRNPGDTGSLNADADSRPRTLNEGRDRNPGDTRCRRRAAPRGRSTLNEGRDRNPGDTRYLGGGAAGGGALRSTKAGIVIPATRGRTAWGRSRTRPALNEGRDRNPGDTESSQSGLTAK